MQSTLNPKTSDGPSPERVGIPGFDSHSASQNFDPSKFLSDDFLTILKEHRKTCEREGKMEQAD